MKIACPNKNTAIYKEVSSKLDKRKTEEFFMKIESDKFNKWYGKGKKDSFGYPQLINGTDIINGVGEKITIHEFGNSQSFIISEKNRKSREKINNEADKARKLISEMKDILTKKIAIYRQKGEKVKYDKSGNRIKSDYVNRIEELLNNLQISEENSAIVFFTDNAIKEIEYAKQRMKALIDNNDEEIKDYRIIKNYVSAYNILDEAKALLVKNPKIDKSYITLLDNAIFDRNELQKTYENEIKDVDAKFLSPYIHNKSEEEIKDLFETAPFDINYLTGLTMYAGSSSDNLLGGIAAAVNDVQDKTRKEHILLMHSTNTKIENLEKSKNTTNPLKLYEEILERDKDGELTGNYISEYNLGGFQKERNKLFDEMNEKFENGTITEKAKKATIAKWFNQNVNHDGSLTDKWKSSKFIELENHRKNNTNKEMVDFYDNFHKVYQEMQERIPEHYNMGYKLPSIRKDSIDRMIEGGITDAFKIMKESASDMFMKRNGDNLYGEILDESGNTVNKIPIFFTGNLPVNEMSLDLGHLLKCFSAMAINYDNMTNIIDELESIGELIKSRKVLKTNSKGKKVINKLKGLENTDVYIEGKNSNIAKQFDEFMAAHVYGKTNKDLGSFDLGFGEIDTNKVLSSLTGYTVKNLLVGNFLNDFANKTLGETVNWMEAGSNGLYNKSQYLKATFEYEKELPKILGDIGARIPESKINIVGEWLNVFQDYRGSINENTNRSKFKKLLSSNSLFFGMKIGEHGIASKAAIASLMNFQPLHNGNPIEGLDTMWDAIKIEDNKFTVDERVTNFNREEQAQFSRKLQETLRENHGNFSNETAAAWQRNALLRMVFSLRRHLAPGVMKRFASRRYNQFLERENEGNYISTANFLKKMIVDLKQMQLSLLKEDWDNLEDFEKQNIKRTIYEAALVLLTYVVMSALSGLKPKDDDYDNRMKLLLSYQANRLNAELLNYIDPIDAWKLLKSPTASMGTIESITTLAKQIITNPTERYKKGYRKGELKVEKDFEQFVPIWRHFKNFNSQGLSSKISWFNSTGTTAHK